MQTVLSTAMRSNLLSLQDTQSGIATAQARLSTGKRVNSALDNPSSFFTAAGLTNRANDLTRLQDAMGLGTKVIEAADKGIKAITKLVEQAQGLANQALQTSDATTRSTLATQFDALRTQIDQLAGDSGYNGTNLIGTGPDSLTVTFNEDGSSTLAVTGVALDSTGLAVAAAANAWVANADITAAVDDLSAGLNTLRANAATFGSNLTVVQNRIDFTKGLTQTLQAGSDLLTLADLNEEGANLLALQTRQQLGIQALSLASQSDQAILRLF